jgi:predicted ATPase/DNA-binding SARP family transcriptional activator
VTFKVLGPLEVERDGRVDGPRGAQPRRLLCLFLIHANEVLSADRLIEALWGEPVPPRATKRLQVAISRLRAALGDDGATLIRSERTGYRVMLERGALDAECFESLAAEGRRRLREGSWQEARKPLQAALGLWRGPALVDVAYEAFAQDEITRLEELRLAAVEDRLEADLELGRHGDVLTELEALVAQHPLRERLRGQLMLALYRAGRHADALQAYRAGRQLLSRELGLEPGPGLRQLEGAILTHARELAAPTTATGDPRRPGQSLPGVSTSLLGREADLDQIASSIRDGGVRVLTLIGPGGVGKTRLAIAAAERLRNEFTDGICFVSLAPLTDTEELAAAIVVALGAPIQEQEPPASALRRFLSDKDLLLVLDNFEHLLDGVPLPAQLVAECPGLTVMVTSREPLRVAAEQLYAVEPLALPPAESEALVAEALRYPAVALFIERARAREPTFRFDSHSARHVTHVCRRLDGLPLALELAASRVGVLEPHELATRLDGALALLTSGMRDAPERQRTLRATVDWSYQLLTEAERRAFARLGVFPGGADLLVAESVTEASLDDLDSLIAKQLVVRRDGRVSMLETIREYAIEKLGQDSEAGVVCARLSAWCLSLVRETTPLLWTRDRLTSQARLDAEMPNIRSALSWLLETGRNDDALRLVSELGPYWFHSFRAQEGLRWTESALAEANASPPELRASALLEWARISGPRRGDQFHRSLEEARELFVNADNVAGVAKCLAHLAMDRTWRGDATGGMALAEEAVVHAQCSGDPIALSRALLSRVNAAPDYLVAVAHAPAAAEQLRSVGNLYGTAQLCNEVGYRALVDGHYQEALQWLDQGLTASHEVSHAGTRYLIRGNQGLALLFLDRREEAAKAFDDALAACVEGGADDMVDETLLGVATLAADRADIARAAQLAGAANCHQVGVRAPGEQAVWDRLEAGLEHARSGLDAHEWERGVHEGGDLEVKAAIEVGRSALARLAEPAQQDGA